MIPPGQASAVICRLSIAMSLSSDMPRTPTNSTSHTHTHTHSENGGIEGYTHKFSGTFHWSVKRTNEDDAGFIFFKLVAE